MSNVKETVRLHICNGGVTFQVEDNGFGPTICVKSDGYGNALLDFKVMTTKKGLIDVRNMLNRAIEHNDYSEDYCHAAELWQDHYPDESTTAFDNPPKME